METFKTVQDLLNWNQAQVSSQTHPNKNLEINKVAKEIANSINSKKDPDLTLEVAKYLLGSLVIWHKRTLDIRREQQADDIHIWAYDYAKLNSALEVLADIQSGESS